MKILMVCLGNICRSPLAQGILQKKITERNLDWHIDSAGTSGWHIGEPPDPRSIEIAAENGIEISHQRGRQVKLNDLDYFDLILAMDTSNYNSLRQLSLEKRHQDKIKMILNYVYPGRNMAVPDPYYDNGFQNVYNLLDAATDELIREHIHKPS